MQKLIKYSSEAKQALMKIPALLTLLFIYFIANGDKAILFVPCRW